ncbi:MAG: metallophosphoesterase, partial [Flavobacteriales bacterium]|nr:metallophosphoesterase [Flavobacteriales bacterium]
NLPPALAGKTLMQISDIHVGSQFDHQFIIDSFIKARDYQPDIVVYTGDYVTYRTDQQLKQLEEVMEKSVVKGKLGTVAILGNHDYGINWVMPEVAEHIVRVFGWYDIPVLRNCGYDVAGLRFIGFDDFWGLNFRPHDAMRGYMADVPTIALCHNPDVCDMDVWNNYQGWILSGHTHGGQFKPPFLPPPVLPVKNKRYSAGEIDLYDGRTLYINRALGNLHQMRFNVRPEITLFELEEETASATARASATTSV